MRNTTESYYSLCLVKSLRDGILAHNVRGSPCSYQQSYQFPEPQGSPCLQIANASSEPAQPPPSSPIPSSPYDVAGPQLQPEPPCFTRDHHTGSQNPRGHVGHQNPSGGTLFDQKTLWPPEPQAKRSERKQKPGGKNTHPKKDELRNLNLNL